MTANIAGCSFNPAIDVNFAHIRDEEFLGGVVLNGYTKESINIHVGAKSPTWINRDMLWITFDYPFRQLGVKRIFGQVPENNEHALAFNEKLGFKRVARVEGVYPDDVACIVMRMDYADCRYLNIKPRGFVPRTIN